MGLAAFLRMTRGARTLCMIATGLLLAAAPGAAGAQDTWTSPFTGVQHLHRRTANQNIHLLKVDLCAPGVSIRATAVSERGRTVPSFAAATGVDAAVNGDFFDGSYGTDGISAHAGQVWGGSDHGYVGPLAFGSRRVELRPHEDQAGFEPWMQEVVSGHPTILFNGQRRDNNGDPLCSNRHPRTAVGLSADRRTLVVAVVDGRSSSRIGMTCDELVRLMTEMGADDAMNLDGGGSSTFWLAGSTRNFPSDGSPRVTGNHLGIVADGAGAAPFCPSQAPRGYIDGAECEAVSGWAQDLDHPDDPIRVHLYFDGAPGQPGAVGVSTSADLERRDLCDAIGSCNHGYRIPVPGALRDGKPHTVAAYGIDVEGIENPALSGGPKTFTCATPAPPLAAGKGARRHIQSADVLAGWGLHFYDVVALTQAVVDEYTDGAPLGAPPDLVRAPGAATVEVLDGEIRRPVSDEVQAAWRFAIDAARELPAAELEAYAVGAAWPLPYVFRGEGPEVYILDVADPSDPGPPDPPGDDGGGDDGSTDGGDGDGAGSDGGGSSSGGCGAARDGRSGGASASLLLLALMLVARAARRRPD